MERSAVFAVALGACSLFALPALAGGRGVMTCPVGYVLTQEARGPACHEPRDATGQASMRHQIRSRCGYPHQPSDSGFRGGAGFVTKDQVRRANGC